MGRRNLIAVAVAAAVSAATVAVPAGSAGAAGLHWQLLADGPSAGPSLPSTIGYVALDRAAGRRFTARLPAAATARLARVDFSTRALVAIFGEFGCRDRSIVVSSIVQRGTKLAVKLVEEPPKAGQIQCLAIFATYRLLLIRKAQLKSPLPTRAEVTLARA